MKRALFALYAALSVSYLVWRAAFTLSPESPVYAALFFAAEVVGVAASFIFYAFVTTPRARAEPPVPRPGLSVDVLITTYNEDPRLLRTTAVAARDMHYPHRTFLCDDGRREEVRALARELGVSYLARPTNEHFKAGNQNHALAATDGELVATFDADHVPRRDFLLRTLGYFDDERTAFVQTPQVYYNVDSFQHSVSARKKTLWHEASLFHHAMQPGADRYGAAFFVGTGAVVRRRALADVGGFATGSITEDIHTSMRLHAHGWRSRYVDEALGYMLAADTPLAYVVQRLRWAQGSMQLLRSENPLFKRGLTAWQRLGYLNAMGVYLLSFQHLLFYVAPALFLLFGMSPIDVQHAGALPIFAAYVAASLALYKVVAAPHARLFLGEVFKLVNLPVFLLASLTFIEPRGLRFRVTPKGAHAGLPSAFLAVPAALCALCVVAAGAGVAALVAGTERNAGALAMTTGFAAYFAVVAAIALLHCLERKEADEGFAFPVRLPALLDDGVVERDVRVERLSRTHAYVRAASAPAPGALVRLRVLGARVPARVVALADGGVAKLAFDDVDPAFADALDAHVFETAVPAFFARFKDAPSGPPPAAVAAEDAPFDPPTEELLLPVRPGML